MELEDAIKSLKNIKKFKDKKPDWRDIVEAIDYARYALMAGDNFSLKFIIVSEADKIQKLAEASQQPFISNAKYVIVVCSDPLRTINLYGDRGEIYCRQQAGAAIQNLLLALNERGLSFYWVRHFVELIIKQELRIPEHIRVEALIPVGYAMDEGKTRKEPIDIDRIIYFEKYGNRKMNPVKKINV